MKVRVLIAEDSVTVRQLLLAILSSDPEIEVVGTATDGQQALEMTRSLRPDVLTMDVHMPVMNGFEATRRIMAEIPTPIVIVSGHVNDRDVEFSLNALRAGAVSLFPRPSGPGAPDFEITAAELRRMVKAMANVKVIRHWSIGSPSPPHRRSSQSAAARVVAIGASTGGPAALELLFSKLPADFPLPILVVQHIAHGFVDGLCSWLDASSALKVRVPRDGDRIEAGNIYLAPEERHLIARRGRTLHLSGEQPVGGFRPSATALFQSVAETYGASAIAVVLTGMGSDGAAGLAAIRSAGGIVIAQDEATSVVFGMPAAAASTGTVDHVLPLPAIAEKLIQLCHPEESR